VKGTIKPRGKSYQVRLPYKNESGIWTARTGTAKTKEAAEVMLRQFISEKTKGIDMSNPSLAEVANEWFKEKQLSASYNTLEVYRYAKNKLIVEFGTTKIKDIKRKDVTNFYNMLKQAGKEPKFIRGVLHSIMLYAISAKYIMDNLLRMLRLQGQT
jgi:hypothetical protein